MTGTTEQAEFAAVQTDIMDAFERFKAGTITRTQLDAVLARMQERTKRMRMPNQNFFSGYISAWLHSVGEDRPAR